jgi:hypothetical protein
MDITFTNGEITAVVIETQAFHFSGNIHTIPNEKRGSYSQTSPHVPQDNWFQPKP